MLAPMLNSVPRKNRAQIVTFGGVNYSMETADGELADSRNMSAARFPCLAQRAGRKTAGQYNHPTGLYARGGLAVIDGTDFIWNGRVVGQVSTAEKHWAAINTKIIIFPDKVYFDTDTETFGRLGAVLNTPAGGVSFTSNTLTVPEHTYTIEPGAEHEDVEIVEEVPEGEDPPAFTVTVYSGVSIDHGTGALTFEGETEKQPDELVMGDILRVNDRKYRVIQYVTQEETEEGQPRRWTAYCVPYEVTEHTNDVLDALFKKGDAIEISGCTTREKNNGSHIIREISDRTITFDRDVFEQTGTEEAAVTLERKVPDLTVICESDNRIWGAAGSTIFASALGDPTNFYVYDGVSTDSYAVNVGTDGEFTGCVAYSSTVLFFKENCMHKILGSYPAQYEIYTYRVPGVQKDSEKSIVVINETVHYKGRDGVYAYSGGTPELITENFGTRRYTDGVAGSDGSFYYISMKGENGWELFTFDTLRSIWLRQDGTHANDFAYLDGVLYYLDADTGRLIKVGQDRSEEGRIEWSATFVPFEERSRARNGTQEMSGKKGYSRLFLRVELEAGAWFKAEVSADGAPFRQVFLSHDQRARTVQVPILPTRCDQFTVRISGKGECVVKSFVREFSAGSEY